MTICKFNKYGHCKFASHCRYQHDDELCHEDACDTKHCSKRHPKLCRFYLQYNRCKFGEYCSYIHEVSKYEERCSRLEDDIRVLNLKLSHLEKNDKKREDETKVVKNKLYLIEKENIILKQDLIKKTEDMENLMKNVITETTQSLVTSFAAQQASHEKQTNSLFDTFQEQINMLLNLFNSKFSTSTPS